MSTDCTSVTDLGARKQSLRTSGRCFNCLRKGTVAIFEHSLFTMFLVSITCAIFVANLMSIPYALIPYYNVSGEDVIMLRLG